MRFQCSLSYILPLPILFTGLIHAGQDVAAPKQQTAAAPIAADSSAEEIVTDSAVSGSSPASTVSSAVDTVAYDADLIEYDVNTRILLLTGNGVMRYRGMVLYADTIHYVINQKNFIATGHPMLIDGGDTVVGEAMTYNLRTRRGRVSMASAASADTRYNGGFIAKSDSNTFYIEHGDYTSCEDIDTPHYTFYGKHIKVEPGKRAITRPVILNITEAPSAALPYYILPLERGRRSGWLRPRWGGNPAFGGYMENIGYYWAPNDYMDYTLAGKITEFEDIVITGSSGYALRYWLGGSLEGRWAQQGDFRARTRQWSLNFSHNQNLLPDQSFTLSGAGSVLSDRTFYRTFSEDTTELLNQNITANLALNKRLPKINASASLSWRRSHNLKTNLVDEELPSVSFSLPSRPLIPQTSSGAGKPPLQEEDTKWYNKIYYGYNARGLQKRAFNMDSTEQTMNIRRGLNHSVNLSSPQKIFNYITVSPNFSVSQSLFDAYIDTTTRIGLRPVIRRDTVAQPAAIGVVVDSLVRPDSTVHYIVERDTMVQYRYNDTTFWYEDHYSLLKAETHSWNTGVNLSTNLYGMFPIRLFNFAGMRHTLSPSVGYTFYPPIESGLRYPSFGIPADVARQGRQSISVSLGNLFQGKIIRPASTPGDKPQEKKFSIVSGSIGASYDFTDRGRGEGWKGKWSDVGLSASTAYKILNVSYSSSYSLYTDRNELDRPVLMRYTVTLRPGDLGANGTLWGGDMLALDGLRDSSTLALASRRMEAGPGWRFGLSPSYSFTRTRKERGKPAFETKKNYHLTTSINIHFTDKWSASTGGYYNFMTNRFEGMSFAFNCDLECWDMSFNWFPSGWNQGSFRFNIGIKKHPDIHWEHRN